MRDSVFSQKRWRRGGKNNEASVALPTEKDVMGGGGGPGSDYMFSETDGLSIGNRTMKVASNKLFNDLVFDKT